ncbi:MAG: MFS transporter [Candidatus Hinthialibacter antarcticus]|nr:MFS transporter [Candidatus Hinthialibacter antarcticus]
MFFFADGFLFGAWASRIPLLQNRLGLSEGELGLLLLTLAAGGVAAMMMTPALLRRLQPRTASSLIGLLVSIFFILPHLAPTVLSAAIAIFFFGACNGSLNVTANADAAATESHCGRTWMSGFHGIFSIGGLIGAVASSLLIFDDANSIAPVILLSAIGFGLFFPTLFVKPTEQNFSAQSSTTNNADCSVPIFLLAALAFACLVSEGAMADWSALLMHKSGASNQLSSLGYGAFAAGMALLRFSGDWLTARFGQTRVIRLGALAATAGLLLALLAMRPGVLLAGFFCVGAGLANVVPVLFRMAARSSARTLAVTTAFGYGGFLIGPVLVGGLADVASLRAAMFVVLFCCATIVLLSRRLSI